MFVDNYIQPSNEGIMAKKGMVYLVITEKTQLYIVKQTGQRSWDAFNLDFCANVEHIHGNRTNILDEVYKQLEVKQVFAYNSNKITLRKAIMEFSAYGTIGQQSFTIEKGQ